MSIVRNDSADAFVARRSGAQRLFLVHGIDDGLIHERAERLVSTHSGGAKDPLGLTRLEGEAISADPGRLLDEVYAMSLFGGERIIAIDAKGRDLAKAFEEVFKRPPSDCVVIVEAGNLKKGSPLRAMFETASFAASVECYPDQRAALVRVIVEEAKAANLTVDADALDLLVGLLGADRLTSRGEVAKLMMYGLGKTRIGVADVEAIVAGAAPSVIDEIVDATMTGNLRQVEALSSRFLSEDSDGAQLLARVIWRATAVMQILTDQERGLSFDDAARRHLVRLPPQARGAIQEQCRYWQADRLSQRLALMMDTAAAFRRAPRLGAATLTRALWALASAAKRERR